MKVLVLPGGKTAMKQDGQCCVINGLLLRSKSKDREDVFYPIWDPFFKIACQPGTEHDYETLPSGKINLL